MVDALNLDDGLVGRCCQHAVIAASPGMVGIYLATQRIRPELSGLINIRYATINPDRDRHLGGQPQAVLALDGVAGKSSDGVIQEVTELARG